MRQPKPLHWEKLKSNIATWRSKVPGGWLLMSSNGYGGGITFYPDANHDWDGESIKD
jgi:hypothetical protein